MLSAISHNLTPMSAHKSDSPPRSRTSGLAPQAGPGKILPFSNPSLPTLKPRIPSPVSFPPTPVAGPELGAGACPRGLRNPTPPKPRSKKVGAGHPSTVYVASLGMGTLPPAVRLLPYQRRWVEDDSQFKIVVKARQVGYSFAATLRAVLKCLEGKTTWIFLSKGERQSRLLMEKVQEHIRSCGIVARAHESTFFEGSLIKQLETRFPNGSVIYGLPANPDTARGYTGNVTLDEFAFHQDAAKVYSALYPTITRGFSIEVISTPNGQQGKFYELAKAAGLVSSEFRIQNSELKASWSGHRVDIYEAVKQGMKIDIEGLRAGCDDEETWLQEYCCAFLSDAANYIPMELIVGCQSESATTDWDFGVRELAPAFESGGKPPQSKGELYLGVDIGRKRDLTVAWLFEKLGDVLWSRALLALKGQTFDVQEKAICDLIEGVGRSQESGVRSQNERPGGSSSDSWLLTSDSSRSITRHSLLPGIRRCSIDQSGLGMMLAERLAKKYGALVEPVQFTAQVKERLAPMVKQAFEDRRVRIPDNREIRADINAVKRFVTPAGNVRFDAEHTEGGHADRFWALALALNAASNPVYHLAECAALIGKPIAAGMRERIL